MTRGCGLTCFFEKRKGTWLALALRVEDFSSSSWRSAAPPPAGISIRDRRGKNHATAHLWCGKGADKNVPSVRAPDMIGVVDRCAYFGAGRGKDA